MYPNYGTGWTGTHLEVRNWRPVRIYKPTKRFCLLYKMNQGAITSCTCKMGYHDMAVTDAELNVHGLEGLRVVDLLHSHCNEWKYLCTGFDAR